MFRLTPRHTLAAGYAGYVSQAIVNNLSPLLFLVFQRQFGLTAPDVSLLITLNFGVQMAMDLAAARFAGKIGCRTLAVAAHLLCGAGLVGFAVFPFLFPAGYAGLAAATVLCAAGGGLIEVIVSPIVQALPGGAKAAAMSLLHSFYCWGHVLVVVLSTLFFTLAGVGGWRWLPLLWAALPLANALLFSRVPLYALLGEGEVPVPAGRLMKSGAFWLLLLLMICAGASEQAVSQWSSLFAEAGLGVSKTVGDLLGPCLFAALMGAVRLVTGRRGAAVKPARVLAAGSVFCLASYLLVVWAPHPLLSLAGCGLCGLGVGAMWPGTFSLSASRFPGGGAALFALLSLAGDVGCVLGPGIVGAVSGLRQGGEGLLGGIKTGFSVVAVFPALMGLALWLLKKPSPHRRGALSKRK